MISFFVPIKKISKRVKNKNIQKIFNFKLGLTEIKILQLKKFRELIKKNNLFNKLGFEFIISSDDKRVEKDDCLEQLILHASKVCRGKYILWTHVTSPLFNHLSYLDFIRKFIGKSKSYDSSFTAYKLKSFIYNHNTKKWISHDRKKNKWPRTQDLDKIYSINHSAFISKRLVYTKYKDRIGKKPLPIAYDRNSYENYDIDEKKDLIFFKKKLFTRI